MSDEMIVLDGERPNRRPRGKAGECYDCALRRTVPQYVESLGLTMERFVCDAFPEGVPADIVGGKVSHTKPYPGDHGIRFTPRKSASTK